MGRGSCALAQCRSDSAPATVPERRGLKVVYCLLFIVVGESTSRNAYTAHAENILLKMLADANDKVRSEAVSMVRRLH